jgi:DNA-damage-inducible protein D
VKRKIILRLRKSFEDCVNDVDGMDFWFARDLRILLDYNEWRNFVNVINKAKAVCKKSGQIVADHFVDINKKVKIGSEAEREIEDLMLTRYACYLIAQNGDPSKEQIAFAQSYFAVQTRKQELIEARIALNERLMARKKLVASEIELSKLIYERGVDETGFARIRSKGDQSLFGGFSTSMMKINLKIPTHHPLADFLPTITITAKNLATEITNFNVKRDKLHGENKITLEHVRNNSDIRDLLSKRGIKPENLPAEEDIRKVKQKFKIDEKRVANSD